MKCPNCKKECELVRDNNNLCEVSKCCGFLPVYGSVEEALSKFNNKSPIKVVRDIICFKEQKDKTYDVILVLQGYQLGHNDKTQCISNRKLLCNIHPDNLDLMVGLYRKCNGNVHIEFLEKDNI